MKSLAEKSKLHIPEEIAEILQKIVNPLLQISCNRWQLKRRRWMLNGWFKHYSFSHCRNRSLLGEDTIQSIQPFIKLQKALRKIFIALVTRLTHVILISSIGNRTQDCDGKRRVRPYYGVH
jgi:hypothetical protein